MSPMSDPVTRLPVADPEEIALRLRGELETLAKLSGGIAHDFNNLLTIILGNAELVEESLPSQSDLLPMVEAIRSTAERAEELADQLMASAKRHLP